MKRFLTVLALALSTASLQADILANGDFHDGKAHWKGDLRTSADQASYDMSTVGHPDATTGVIIDLKGIWTKIYQGFNTHENSFSYSITYKLSPDYAPMGGNMPGGMPPTMPNRPGMPNQRNDFLSALLGGNYSGNISPPHGNTFLLLVVDMTASTFSSALISPTPGSTDAQTATGTIPYVKAHDEKTLYLIFPGGKGSVTLLNVALTPVTNSSAPSPGGLTIPDLK